MTQQNEGDGRHDDVARQGRWAAQHGKGQYGDMRHDDGDKRQHGDGKGQQGKRRYNDGDGRHDKAARRRRRAANYYD